MGFRQEVWRRDHGVCSDCGLDCDRLERVYRRLSDRLRGRRYGYFSKWLREIDTWAANNGYPSPGSRSLWEADHVLPRHLGGTNDVKNGRTLCVVCHHFPTTRLARFRAHSRKLRIPLAAESFS